MEASAEKTILLVEDNDDDATLFEHAVVRSKVGGVVHRVDSADAAIACMQNGLAPRLVFLDLLLPNLRGTHFLRWIRAQEDFKCVPVIVLTGEIPRQTMSDLTALGVTAVMIKPYAVASLQEAVSSACTFWFNHCVPPRGSEKT